MKQHQLAPVLVLLLAGCGEQEGGKSARMSVEGERPSTVVQSSTKVRVGESQAAAGQQKVEGRAKIIDPADVFAPDEVQALSEELAEANSRGLPRMTLVMVRPTAGESLEQVGWAVAAKPQGDALVLLVDPETGRVRVEGAIPPERKASVAAAMSRQLQAKDAAGAVRAAIAALESES